MAIPSCSSSSSSPSTAIITAPHPRKLGHVKFFNSTKGYGFIIPAEGQQQLVLTGQPPVEVFVHHTAITGGGFKSLAEGEEVEYDLIQGPKGMQAANVSGPGGKPVQGDPNAHRPYHYHHHHHHHRYQNGGGHHHHYLHPSSHQQQHDHQQASSNGSVSDGGNVPSPSGHLGYTVYGMPPYGYPIYAAAGAYMVPTTAGYYHHHHQFASSQSSPQLKPSIAMYYPYPPMAPATAAQPHHHHPHPHQQHHLSNSSSSSSSNHTATTCEPESEDVSSSSPSC